MRVPCPGGSLLRDGCSSADPRRAAATRGLYQDPGRAKPWAGYSPWVSDDRVGRGARSGSVRIGTSGWQYRDWRGPFYPPEVPAQRWLEQYSQTFCSVEANGTFYRLPEATTFAAWAQRTPEGFDVAVKASRYLTHVRRLRDPGEPVARLLERARELGDKLGPVLVQLPPTLRCDLVRLDETLAAFPPSVRVAVELRHPSWVKEATASLLERHGAALCLADRRGPLAPRWRTAEWGYLRFHEGRAMPPPRYGREALHSWAEWLAGEFGPDRLVYAYFNNDAGACAPRNALEFARICEAVGLFAPLAPPAAGPAARAGPVAT